MVLYRVYASHPVALVLILDIYIHIAQIFQHCWFEQIGIRLNNVDLTHPVLPNYFYKSFYKITALPALEPTPWLFEVLARSLSPWQSGRRRSSRPEASQERRPAKGR